MAGKYSEVTKQVLLMLGVTGIVVIAAAAPGALLAAKLFEGTFKDKEHQLPQGYNKKSAARSLRRLKDNKLIQIKERNGTFEIQLTGKGREQVKKIQLANKPIAKPAYWDKKWRIVIFDIPDKSHKYGREALRGKLKEWEFYPLQKSVWVCPWPCENEIRLVAELYEVSQYVNIIIAERIVDDILLRKRFKL